MRDHKTDTNLKQAGQQTQAALKKRTDAILENAKLIDGCEGPHQFVPEGDKGDGRPVRYRCSKCQGIAAPNERLWYEHGREHAVPAINAKPEGA